MYDVIIVGAGPAGLSAALMLGRCHRSVFVCDTGRSRNARSHALHGFLTRDGINPADFLSLARDELGRYTTVELRNVEMAHAESRGSGSTSRWRRGSARLPPGVDGNRVLKNFPR